MVGGLWRIDNDNGGVAAYKTLHLNSSRPLTQYPSYPMPEDWPDYPPHEMIATYFQGFAEDNRLLERITFRTEVTSVEPLAGDGAPGSHGWAVTVAGGQRRTYRARDGRQRPPRRAEHPGLPRRVHRRDVPRPRLPRPGGLHRQGRGRRRGGQLRDGHRLRRGQGRPPRVPGDPARRARDPQVRLRQAGRPARQPADGLHPVPRRAHRCTRRSCGCPPAGPRTAGCPSPTTACCTPTRRSPPSSTTASGTATSP